MIDPSYFLSFRDCPKEFRDANKNIWRELEWRTHGTFGINKFQYKEVCCITCSPDTEYNDKVPVVKLEPYGLTVSRTSYFFDRIISGVIYIVQFGRCEACGDVYWASGEFKSYEVSGWHLKNRHKRNLPKVISTTNMGKETKNDSKS